MLCRCCQRALWLLSNKIGCDLQVLLTEERLKPVRHIKGFLPLLEYILVRDQRRRPSIEDVIARCLRVPGCCSEPLLAMSWHLASCLHDLHDKSVFLEALVCLGSFATLLPA